MRPVRPSTVAHVKHQEAQAPVAVDAIELLGALSRGLAFATGGALLLFAATWFGPSGVRYIPAAMAGLGLVGLGVLGFGVRQTWRSARQLLPRRSPGARTLRIRSPLGRRQRP